MVAAVATLELQIEWSRSLKDRRRVVRAAVDRLRNRLNVCVVEDDDPVVWQRARLAVGCLARTEGEARRTMEHVRSVVEREIDAVLAGFEVSFYC